MSKEVIKTNYGYYFLSYKSKPGLNGAILACNLVKIMERYVKSFHMV